jgi:hypothetical protein
MAENELWWRIQIEYNKCIVMLLDHKEKKNYGRE